MVKWTNVKKAIGCRSRSIDDVAQKACWNLRKWRSKCVSDCLQDTIFRRYQVLRLVFALKTQLKNGTYSLYLARLIECWPLWRLGDCPYFSVLSLLEDRRVAYRVSRALEFISNISLILFIRRQSFIRSARSCCTKFLLCIPTILSMKTMSYIAKGGYPSSMVKYIVIGFMSDLDGVICPSEIVW